MIIGGITLGITTVIADTIINSTSVAYKTTTVKAALDELYDIADFKQEVKDMLYPVGSIYISVSSTNPSQLFGGTWESIGTGRVLQGSDGQHSAGTTIAAGLPNITGWSHLGYEDESALSLILTTSYFDGALYNWGQKRNTRYLNTALLESVLNTGSMIATPKTDDYTTVLQFDASRSNSVYGGSTTVQPNAYVVNMWKRTA